MLRWDRLAAAVALSTSLLLPTSLAVGQTAGGGGSTSSGAGTTAGSMGGTGTGSMGSTGSGQFRSNARGGMTRQNQGQGRAGARRTRSRRASRRSNRMARAGSAGMTRVAAQNARRIRTLSQRVARLERMLVRQRVAGWRGGIGGNRGQAYGVRLGAYRGGGYGRSRYARQARWTGNSGASSLAQENSRRIDDLYRRLTQMESAQNGGVAGGSGDVSGLGAGASQNGAAGFSGSGFAGSGRGSGTRGAGSGAYGWQRFCRQRSERRIRSGRWPGQYRKRRRQWWNRLWRSG